MRVVRRWGALVRRGAASLAMKLTAAAQRRPWTVCLIGGVVAYGAFAGAAPVVIHWEAMGFRSFPIYGRGPRIIWEPCVFAGLLGGLAVVSSFWATMVMRVPDMWGRLSSIAVATVAAGPVAVRWAGDWEDAVERTLLPVVVALVWPQVLLGLWGPRLVGPRWSRGLGWIWVGLAAWCTLSVAWQGPELQSHFPFSSVMQIMAVRVVAIPLAFRSGVESSLRFWAVAGVAGGMGLVSSWLPALIGRPVGRNVVYLFVPWLIAGPLVVLARTAVSLTALPADHAVTVWTKRKGR